MRMLRLVFKNQLVNVWFWLLFFSFGDVGGNAIQGDLTFLIAGYMIVIAFVAAVLGKFNCLEQRVSEISQDARIAPNGHAGGRTAAVTFSFVLNLKF